MKRGSAIVLSEYLRLRRLWGKCIRLRIVSKSVPSLIKNLNVRSVKRWIKTYRLGTSLSEIETAVTTSSETWWLTVTCTERRTENKIILCSGAVRYKCKENLRGLRWGISENTRLRLLLLIRLSKTIIVLTTKDWAWWCLIWCWVRCSKSKWLKINFIWASDWSANERQ